MDQLSVLIISDDAEFSRSVAARWQCEPTVPAFTLMSGDLCAALSSETFDFAIVGALESHVLEQLVQVLSASGKPVLYIRPAAQSSGSSHRGMKILRQEEGWLDTLLLIGSEILRRCEAVTRAQRLEQANVLLQRQATLGRYILDMRHTLNNALTSVLGNAELLLLEPGSLKADLRSQIDTIRNMALRMHEVLQRFSSLENELKVMENQVQQDQSSKARAASGA
ncbi:MAG: histidine kinase dimerization/phospho-acceptor domain-containing protein [Acidobacteriaceae bacterium]